MEKLITPKLLAKIFNVKMGTVYSWISRDVDMPPYVKIGGSTRWREKTVQAWIEAREKERKRKHFQD